MPHDRIQLRALSTAYLNYLLNNYKQIRRNLRSRFHHSARATTYNTDQARCKDAMDDIRLELRRRAKGGAITVAAVVPEVPVEVPPDVPPPFDPNTLSPHAFWLAIASGLFEEEDGTGEITVGEAVGYVTDQSGNDIPWTQATASSRPVYQTSGGFGWLEFDGADDMMTAALSIPQPVERWTAMRVITDDMSNWFYGPFGFGSSRFIEDNQLLTIHAGSIINDLGNGIFTGQDIVFREVYDGANSFAYVDGVVKIDTGSAGTNNLGNGTMNVGTLASGDGNTNMRIYGTILTPLLSEADAALLLTYMAELYGGTL